MNNPSQIWIAEDDRSLRWVMEKALVRDGIAVRSFETGDELLQALKMAQPEIIISDIRMPGIDGLELLKEIHGNHSHIPVIITTAHSDLDSAVAAYQGGAFEYLPKPFDLEELVDVARRGLSFAHENRSEPAPPAQLEQVKEIIGEAPAMQEVFRAIGRLSNSNITVLINGESGTGKELVAQALHKHSPRRNNKFIALNMAAIPNDLIESELFGHEKGAFPVRGSAVQDVLSSPTVAHCSSTRSAICPLKPRPGCCEYWRMVSSIESAAIQRLRSMCALLLLPIRILNLW